MKVLFLYGVLFSCVCIFSTKCRFCKIFSNGKILFSKENCFAKAFELPPRSILLDCLVHHDGRTLGSSSWIWDSRYSRVGNMVSVALSHFSFPPPGMRSVARGPCPRVLCAGVCCVWVPSRQAGSDAGLGLFSLIYVDAVGIVTSAAIVGNCRRSHSPSFDGPGLNPTVNTRFPTAEAGTCLSVLSLYESCCKIVFSLLLFFDGYLQQ